MGQQQLAPGRWTYLVAEPGTVGEKMLRALQRTTVSASHPTEFSDWMPVGAHQKAIGTITINHGEDNSQTVPATLIIGMPDDDLTGALVLVEGTPRGVMDTSRVRFNQVTVSKRMSENRIASAATQVFIGAFVHGDNWHPLDVSPVAKKPRRRKPFRGRRQSESVSFWGLCQY